MMRCLIGILIVSFSFFSPSKSKAELIAVGEVTDFSGNPIDPTTLDNSTNYNAAIGFNAVGSITQDASVVVNGITATDTDRTRIGHEPGSDGTLSLSGFGVSWGARFSTVGSGGKGELNIRSGARFNSRGEMYIGSGGGSTGITNVSGIGSVLTTGTTLFVGNSGDGTLNITDGARASTFLSIGFGTSATGRVLVFGANSLVDSPSITLGYSGRGALDIRDAASVNSTGFSRIGRFSGSQGKATVSGSDSKWNLGGSSLQSLYIGESGIGTLNIGRGAVVAADFDVILGESLTGVGTLAFTIGDDGNGKVASGLLEVGGEFDVGNGLGFFQLTADSPFDLAVDDVFTLVNYDTYSGDLLLVNDGMSISPLADGGNYTTENGVVFRIDYDADLDGMGDLGMTATVTEIATIPEPATLAMLIVGVFSLVGQRLLNLSPNRN